MPENNSISATEFYNLIGELTFKLRTLEKAYATAVQRIQKLESNSKESK